MSAVLLRRRKRGEPMPHKFERLARYNAEVSRGLVHTDRWQREMADLQAEFNEWASKPCPGCGLTVDCLCPRSA